LLVVGHFYAGLTIYNAALLLFALAAVNGRLPLPARISSPWQAVGRAAVCLVAVGATVALARFDFVATQQQTGGEPAAANPYDNFQP